MWLSLIKRKDFWLILLNNFNLLPSTISINANLICHLFQDYEFIIISKLTRLSLLLCQTASKADNQQHNIRWVTIMWLFTSVRKEELTKIVLVLLGY